MHPTYIAIKWTPIGNRKGEKTKRYLEEVRVERNEREQLDMETGPEMDTRQASQFTQHDVYYVKEIHLYWSNNNINTFYTITVKYTKQV